MVNIVRAILGLNEDDGKEIAKAVKEVKKKEKKVKKKEKKAKAKIQKKIVHGEEPEEVELESKQTTFNIPSYLKKEE